MAALAIVARRRSARFIAGFGLLAVILAVVVTHVLDLTAVSGSSDTITINGHDALAVGLQDVYNVELSDPAGIGGVVVTLDSNEANCVLAHTPSDSGGTGAITVTVPQGHHRTNFIVQTVPGASGVCEISATAPSWVSGAATIDIVTGKLRIRDLPGHIGPQAGRNPFFVEVGVPTADGEHIRYIQDRSKQFSDLDVTVCSDAPSVGTIVNVYGQDIGADGCEDNPVIAPFSRTVPGEFQFAPVSGSGTPVNVVASASGFLDAERTVTIGALSVSVNGPEEIGAGLQDSYALRLSDDAASNLSVTISVADTADCVVAATEQSLGQGSITRTVPQGRYRAEFVVQGVAITAPGSPCVVTVDAGSFGTDTIEIDVKEPALRLRDVPSTIGQFAPSVSFFVETGVPDNRNHGLRFVQGVRAGTSPTANPAVSVTVSSSDKTIATIVDETNTDNGNDGSESADVTVGASRTAPGQLRLDPVAGSTTPVDIVATAVGFAVIDASAKQVTVKGAALNLTGHEELASSLQDDYRVELNASSGHPAATVTLTSLTPSVCKVAPNGNTAGTNSIDRNVAAGDSAADFVVQAAEMIDDVECQIEATSSGFETADLTITVRQGGIRIRQLPHNFSTDSPNHGFVVEVGLPSENGRDLRRVQRSRPSTSIPFDVCSSDKVVGTIVDKFNVDNGGDGCESDSIVATFATSVPNSLKFDPLSAGSTVATVTAAGFTTVGSGIVEIRVGGDSLRLGLSSAIGSGLQSQAAVRLSTTAASNVVVTLTSSTPDKCLVAANATTAGSTSTTLTIATGQRSGDFVVAALEGLDDVVCTVKATATGFLSDEQETEIVSPGLQISDLDASTGTTAPADTFYVQIGAPRRSGAGLQSIQAVRIGGVAVPVTVCSDNTAIGTIVGGVGGCLTQNINPGQFQVSFSFQVTGATGSTKVTVNGAGDSESRTVRVSPTSVKLGSGPKVLGKNLQGVYNVSVNHDGGVSVTAHAEPSSICVVSLDPTVAGDGLDKTVVVAAGTDHATLVVQALDTGDCTVTLSGSGFPTDTTTIPVVQSRLRIRSIDTSVTPRAPNEPFYVEIGPKNEDIDDVLSNRDNRYAISKALPRRAGAPLTVQVCSSNPAVALVHDPLNTAIPPSPPSPQCVTATIAANSSATDDFELDPVSNGTIDVTAAPSSEVDVDDTLSTVEVRADSLAINGPDAVANYLQAQYSVAFSPAPPSGTSVTIKATGGGCGLAVGENDAPSNQIILPIPSGRARADFWVQGLVEGAACSISIDTPPAGFTPVVIDVDIPRPAVQIRGLDTKVAALSKNDEFRVVIGVPADSLRDVRIPQEVRPNYGLPVTDSLPGVPLKVCSSNTMVGVIVGGIANGDCRKVVIPPLQDEITLEFDPLMGGSTIVSLVTNGVPLILTDRSSFTVTVVPATISIQPTTDLGVGLQDSYNVVLSTDAPIDASATIYSLTPTVCLVGPDEDGPFGITANVPIKKGRTRASFSLQALLEGECRLSPTTSAGGYTTVERSIDVIPLTVRITNLDTSRALQAKNDAFDVDIGIPSAQLRRLAEAQDARYGGGGVPVRVCSSDPAVAMIPGAGVDGCKIVTVAELSSRTPDGSLELDPVGAGTTTICASTPGYVPITSSCKDVRVAAVVVEVNGHDDLGSGLQDEYTLVTSASMASASTFTVTSLTPLVCVVAPNLTTAGSANVAVTIPQGRSRASFVVQAYENVTGLCVLAVTPPVGSGITDGYREINVVNPSARIINLDTSRSTTSANDPFNVQIGVPTKSLRTLDFSQAARIGGGGVLISVCSSDTGVALIVGAAVDGCKYVTIPEGEDQTADGALEFDPYAGGSTTVCVYPPPYYVPVDASCRDVVVSPIVANINGRDELSAHLQDEYVLALSQAVSADTTITIATTTPTACLLAPNATTAGSASINVVVPKNRSRATFVLQGVNSGECELYITPPVGAGIADGVRAVEIVQPGLRIVNLDTTRATQALNDPFNVEVGLPQASLRSLRAAQADRIGGGNIPVTVCSSNPTVAQIVGSGPDYCKTVYVNEGQTRTADGQLELDVYTGGTTTICAYSPGFITTDQGCRDVRVSSLVTTINGHDQVAAGLQDEYKLSLSTAIAATSTFTVTSTTTAICKVALTPSGASSNYINVQVAQGRSTADFVVQGLTTGTCILTTTSPVGSGIIEAYREIDIVEPAARIINLDTSDATQAPNDPFNVQVGVPDGGLRSLAYSEAVRIGGGGIPITVCSSNTAVGTIVGAVAGCKTVTIPEGEDQTPDGALYFDPVSGGVTTICAYGPGFVPVDRSCRDVRVSSLVTNINGHDVLGSGLQDEYTLTLSTAVVSTSTFTVTSTTPGVCKVALDSASAGASSINVTVLGGRSRADFVVQALEVVGTCTLTTTAPVGSGIIDAYRDIEVSPNALRILNLDSSRATQSPNDPFNVEVGVPDGRLRGLSYTQQARFGGPGVPVSVCSSNTTVAIVVGHVAGCKATTIAAGQERTADGALELDPLTGGSTTICAYGGGTMISGSCKDVRVASLVTNINGHDQIGAGLQEQYVLALSASLAATSTFTVISQTPTLCKVAPNAATAGTASINVSIQQGRSRADIIVQGMEGVTGTCILTSTSPVGSGIIEAYREIEITPLSARIINLDASRATQAANDPFNVEVGVANSSLSSLAFSQAARVGGGGIPVTSCSSYVAVGIVVGHVGGCKTVYIPEGEDQTPDGGFEFDGISAGTTTICATAPDGIPVDNSCRDVRVSAIVSNINGRDDVGAGLQEEYTLALSNSVNADTTITIATTTPGECKVSPNATTAGTNSINVVIAKNHSRASFFVQGLNVGLCELTATPPGGAGISDGVRQIDIVTPALRLINLDTSRATQSANDPFNVELGLPQASLKSLTAVEAVRAGATSVNVTVCSSNPAVANIPGSVAGCKTVAVPAGQSRTADGLLELDPISGGTTTVCAYAPGFIATDAACKDINVSAVVPNINGPDTLGATLQEEYTLSLSSSVASDTVFTITSTTTSTCRVSTVRSTAGSTSINVTVPTGRSRADFYIQGWDDAGTCNLTMSTSNPAISPGAFDLEIVMPGLRIVNLASSFKTGSADDNFEVEIGVPSGNLRSLSRVQERRGGIANLTVTACSANTAVATVVGTATADPACKTATIAATSTRTVATAFALHTVAAGTATIYATAPGFVATDAASKDITASSGSISISGADALGSGLQDTFTVNLNPRVAATGGTPITLTSLTPTLCKVSANITTAGATTYAFTVAKGKSSAKIAIQALESVTGTCVIRSTTTDPVYVGEDFEIPVMQPAVRIRALDASTTAAAANDGFFIDVGVPRDNLRTLRLIQTVRAGAPASLTVQACSSNTAAGVILGTATADPACKSALISVGESGTATNALVFDPVGSGTTIVTASAPGYITITDGVVEVYVASTALSLTDTNGDRIGAGLMETFNVKSSSSVGLDTTVTITSLTPDLCLVATTDATAAAAAVNVVIGAGHAKETFVIHGVEFQSGTCELRATSSGFADGIASFDIVQPAIRIEGLGTSKSSTSADDAFSVGVGVAKASLSNLQTRQKVRTGSAGLPITVCSSDAAVGKILAGGIVDICRTVTLAAGESETATSLLKFRVVAGGTTTVDAAAPFYVVTDAGTVDITVSGAGLALDITTANTNPIGSGLQRGGYTVERTGSTASAVTVTVTSLTTPLCKVATANNVAGATSINLTIAAGSTISSAFWVQGMDAVVGVCDLQVTATSYPTGSASVFIVKPAVRLNNLAGSIANTAANDAFNVEIGIPDSGQTTLLETQQVRALGSGFWISVANGNSAVGQLIGSDYFNSPVAAQTVSVFIFPGQSTNTTGGFERLEFDPNNSLAATAGTSVTATNADVITTSAGSQVVAVVVGGGC